jgi:hypothetical protein
MNTFLQNLEIDDSPRELLAQLARFDLFLRRINAHLLIYHGDLMNFELPESFLIWKTYYFFFQGYNNDKSSQDVDYQSFLFTELMVILDKYFEYTF